MEHHHDYSSMQETPLEETTALLDYMVHHNQAHAQELKEVAMPLKDSRQSCFQKIEGALALFDQANHELEEALSLLREGK